MRNTDERFESRLLPLFASRTAKVAEPIPQLYLHGMSEGDFALPLRAAGSRRRNKRGPDGTALAQPCHHRPGRSTLPRVSR